MRATQPSKLRFAGVAGLVASALLTSLGLYGLSSAIQGGDRTGEPATDPCYGISSEECRALIEESNAEFFTKLGPWILTIPTDEEYLRTLPHGEIMASGPPPLADIVSVISAAEAVVVGHSKAIAFNEDLTSTITFRVEDYLVGSGPDTVEITQGGGPQPHPEDWSPLLGHMPGDQLLLPGDRALLFLARDPGTHVFGIVPTSGHYRFDDNGGLVPMPGNPFADSVSGVSLEDFTADIKSLAE